MDRHEIKSAMSEAGLDTPTEWLDELQTWARALQKLVDGYNADQPVLFDVAEVQVMTETLHEMLKELGIQ